MPVDNTQPVYPPSPGKAIEASWGDHVSEHVIQRFTRRLTGTASSDSADGAYVSRPTPILPLSGWLLAVPGRRRRQASRSTPMLLHGTPIPLPSREAQARWRSRRTRHHRRCGRMAAPRGRTQGGGAAINADSAARDATPTRCRTVLVRRRSRPTPRRPSCGCRTHFAWADASATFAGSPVTANTTRCRANSPVPLRSTASQRRCGTTGAGNPEALANSEKITAPLPVQGNGLHDHGHVRRFIVGAGDWAAATTQGSTAPRSRPGP